MNRKRYQKPESICQDIDVEDVIIATSEIEQGEDNGDVESKKRVFGWDDYEYDSFGNNN